MEWLVKLLGLTPVKGDRGEKGEKGDRGEKGETGNINKIDVPIEELYIRKQSIDDYFLILQDRLQSNLDPSYTHGGHVEHSFFKENTIIDEDLDYLRMVIVTQSNEVVKHLPKEEIKKVIASKRLVPGCEFWGLDISMGKSFMETHLTNSEDRIMLIFVGDKREFITSQFDTITYLLYKTKKLETEFQRISRYRF